MKKRVFSGTKAEKKLKKFFQGRVAIFIDAANIAKSVDDFGYRVSYRGLKRFFAANFKLVYLGFYSVAFDGEKHQQFLKFLSYRGFHLVTKPLKVIRGPKSEEIKKANFDVEISVEAMEKTSDFDTLVLFSGDSDFEYLLKKLKLKGKRLIVFSTRHHIAKELIAACDKYFDLRKFKEEFLRKK